MLGGVNKREKFKKRFIYTSSIGTVGLLEIGTTQKNGIEKRSGKQREKK
jgi:hypothetical protein